MPKINVMTGLDLVMTGPDLVMTGLDLSNQNTNNEDTRRYARGGFFRDALGGRTDTSHA